MAKKQEKDIVTIICYGQVEKMEREQALDKYFDCMMMCEGSEGERYKNIYCQLKQGEKVCVDRY